MTMRDESITEPFARDHVGSLARGLSVMEILALHPSGLTLTETAEKAGLTRAGARRFLLTLVASGYALQDGRVFRLSPRLITLARTWVSGASLWAYAEPFMREVSTALNESCSAAVLADEDVVYVARIAGARIVSVGLHVGTRLPALWTSMGRVLLSDLTPVDLDRFLARATMDANTEHSVMERDALARHIMAARTDGYAIVDQELEIGLRSIAVPIRDRNGRIVAAINISTQSARTSLTQMKRDFLPCLRTAAESIENYFVVQ